MEPNELQVVNDPDAISSSTANIQEEVWLDIVMVESSPTSTMGRDAGASRNIKHTLIGEVQITKQKLLLWRPGLKQFIWSTAFWVNELNTAV